MKKTIYILLFPLKNFDLVKREQSRISRKKIIQEKREENFLRKNGK